VYVHYALSSAQTLSGRIQGAFKLVHWTDDV